MTENKNQLDNQEKTKKFDYEITMYDINSPMFKIIEKWFKDNIGDSEQHREAIGNLVDTIEDWLYEEGFHDYYGMEDPNDEDDE